MNAPTEASESGAGERAPEDPAPGSLTAAVRAARLGLRSQVAKLIDTLKHGELLVPLADDIPDVPEGERIELDESLSLTPHMVVDGDGQPHGVFFTEPQLALELAEHLGWQTSGGELKLCAFPAMGALDMTLELLDEGAISGLVLNPASDAELQLGRDEIASLLQARALPLVGYVNRFAPNAEHTLIAEPGSPPPADFLEALKSCLNELDEITEHRLERTFNPERDREPHFSLTLTASKTSDAARLAESVSAALEGHLPEPGYIDIFVDAAES